MYILLSNWNLNSAMNSRKSSKHYNIIHTSTFLGVCLYALRKVCLTFKQWKDRHPRKKKVYKASKTRLLTKKQITLPDTPFVAGTRFTIPKRCPHCPCTDAGHKVYVIYLPRSRLVVWSEIALSRVIYWLRRSGGLKDPSHWRKHPSDSRNKDKELTGGGKVLLESC